MSDWRVAHIGFGDDGLKIGGLEVWKHEWRPVKARSLELPHPAYPAEIHGYKICEIGNQERPVVFAAAELSPGVWGFYVPV